MAGDVGGRSCTDSELLLHPELLSQEFLLLTLEQVRRAPGRAGLLERALGLELAPRHPRRRRTHPLLGSVALRPAPLSGKRRPQNVGNSGELKFPFWSLMSPKRGPGEPPRPGCKQGLRREEPGKVLEEWEGRVAVPGRQGWKASEKSPFVHFPHVQR